MHGSIFAGGYAAGEMRAIVRARADFLARISKHPLEE
jgi:hypothetical protein